MKNKLSIKGKFSIFIIILFIFAALFYILTIKPVNILKNNYFNSINYKNIDNAKYTLTYYYTNAEGEQAISYVWTSTRKNGNASMIIENYRDDKIIKTEYYGKINDYKVYYYDNNSEKWLISEASLFKNSLYSIPCQIYFNEQDINKSRLAMLLYGLKVKNKIIDNREVYSVTIGYEAFDNLYEEYILDKETNLLLEHKQNGKTIKKYQYSFGNEVEEVEFPEEVKNLMK